MKRIAVVGFVGFLFACGGGTTPPPAGPTEVKQDTTQVVVSPKGSLVGRVTDAYTGQPLAGVTVKVNSSPVKTATTDDSGLYAVADLPAGGNAYAFFELSNYVRGLCQFSIDDTAGNSPMQGAVATCNQVLGKADGEVRGNVLLPNGVPAAGAIVVIDMRPNGHDAVATTAVAADGTFRIVGLATSASTVTYTLRVNPYDQNADGIADYGAVARSVSVTQGAPARVVVTLSNVGQTVVASNVFDGDIAPTDDIQFTFAFPVLTTSNQFDANTQFRLTNTTRGGQELAVDVTWVSDISVKVKPKQALEEGHEYRIRLSLVNVGGGTNFTPTYNFQARPATITPMTAQVTNLIVTNTAPFNHNSTSFSLAWNGVTGAASYLVWAKDTTQNQNYVLLDTILGQCVRCTTTVSLAGFPSFDVNSYDGNQPLSFGNKVTFTVVPLDYYGNFSPLASSPTVMVQDTVAPSATSFAILDPPGSTYDAINDETTPSTIQVRVNFNEPMDTATPPTFVTTANVTTAWVWEYGTYINSRGLFTITIPAGGDATGPFSIRGGKDSSGNPIVQGELQGYLTGRKELLVNPGFESGNCSISGWTAAQLGSAVAPTASNVSVRSGSCSAVLGFPPGTTPQTGQAKLYQDVALPTIPTGAAWAFYVSIAYRNVAEAVSGMTMPSPAATQTCSIVDPANELTVYVGLNSGANANTTPNASFSTIANAVLPTSYAGQTVRVLCDVNNTTTQPANVGMFIDDVSVSLWK